MNIPIRTSPTRGFLRFALFLFASLLLLSCKDNNNPPSTTLVANAGADKTGTAGVQVILDGSASTGPVGFKAEWIFNNGPVQQSEINLVNDPTLPKATFTPPVNGTYSFSLRLTNEGEFNEDQVTVVISGALTLGGTATFGTLALKDIELGTGPDYRLTSDLTLPAGASITFPSTGSVNIEVSDNVAIIIDGGSLVGQGAKFTSLTGWKGIWLKSGSLSLSLASRIEQAGKSAHTGQTESAAVVITGGLANVGGVIFAGTTGYDVLFPTTIPGSHTIQSNIFSATKPIKMPIELMGTLGDNAYPQSYDYIHLTTPGAGTSVGTSGANGFYFRPGVKYYIDGDFTAGSTITGQSLNGAAPTTVLMKAGAGILCNTNVSITGGVIFDGLSGAGWKGIAIGGAGTTNIQGIIKNAGSAVFNTGSFTSDAKAAIYFTNGDGSISGSVIQNSQGYGLYVVTPTSTINTSTTTFTNSALAAISVRVERVHAIVNPNITYTMTAGVAAVEARVSSSLTSPTGTWPSLGGGNFYVFTNNVFMTASWILSPGVNLRFPATKGLYLSSTLLTAIGTAVNQITFNSVAGTAGTWSGILIETLYKLEYCQILNGGDAFLLKGGVTPATEKANVVVNVASGANTFKNNTITGSPAYGLLVEATKQNPDAANPTNANTFNTNTSGNIIIK